MLTPRHRFGIQSLDPDRGPALVCADAIRDDEQNSEEEGSGHSKGHTPQRVRFTAHPFARCPESVLWWLMAVASRTSHRSGREGLSVPGEISQ